MYYSNLEFKIIIGGQCFFAFRFGPERSVEQKCKNPNEIGVKINNEYVCMLRPG
jgi:hypothetical protein